MLNKAGNANAHQKSRLIFQKLRGKKAEGKKNKKQQTKKNELEENT